MDITLEHMSKRFGGTLALDDVDLSIEAGERVGLIGANGSGKTTLIRAIMGMIRVEGTVRVGDWSPFDERKHLAEHIAYVPQIAPTMGVPVRQILATVCTARQMPEERVAEICEVLGFDLMSHRDKDFRELSGGMKQKLLIGMALAARPRLLVMDEPSASLDADARRRFFERCAELSSETTVLLCSHRLEEVRHLIDRIVALEDGRVVADDATEAFVADMGRAAIELRVTEPSDDLEAWLAEHDFKKLSGGRFVAFVPWEQKLDLARAVMNSWSDELEDLVVEDVHDLQVDLREERRAS